MKMTTSLMIIFLSAIVTLLPAQSDFDSPGERDRERRPPRIEPGRIGIDKPALPPPRLLDVSRLRVMMKEIGISDSGANRIVTLTIGFNNQLERKLIEVQREELNVKEAILSPTPDMKAIEPVIKRKAMIIADIEIAQVKRDLAIRALLSDEEFERWKAYMQRAPGGKDDRQQQLRQGPGK
jgi:hypothetical protein